MTRLLVEVRNEEDRESDEVNVAASVPVNVLLPPLLLLPLPPLLLPPVL